MGRWRRHLDPSIRKDAWTAEEDSQLRALHEEHGTSWSCIAKELADRTPQQCRGRWCVLTGTTSKGKQGPSPPEPETPHQERARSTRRGPGAVAVAAAPATRAACASTASRRAATELPMMPASLLAQPPADAAPATVQQARPAVQDELPSAGGAAEQARQAAPVPASFSVGAGGDGEHTDSQEEGGEEGGEHGSPERAGSRKGRLPLGRRTVSLRRRPRSTQVKPQAAARLGSAPTGPGRCASAAAAAVALLSPPRGAFALADGPEEDETAMLRSFLEDDGDDEGNDGDGDAGPCGSDAADPGRCPTSAGCNAGRAGGSGGGLDARCGGSPRGQGEQRAAGAAPRCPRRAAGGGGGGGGSRPLPSASTGTQGSGGAAGGEDVSSRRAKHGDARCQTTTAEGGSAGEVLMSPRKTRSGRCYTPIAGSAKAARTRHRGPAAAGSTGTPQTADATTTTTATTASEPRSSPAARNSGATPTEPPPAHDGAAAAPGALRLPGAGTAAPDHRLLADAAGVVAAALALEHAPEALEHAPEAEGGELAGAEDELLDQVDELLQMVGGSAASSLGAPSGLLGSHNTAGAAAGGAHPADWHLVGSPPSSSLLGLLQAGLLQTPTGTPGASPGLGVLNAPIPPGMQQVTPGGSTEWSDVPAASWSAWRNCNGGFGVLARPPDGSAQGTPDNTKPAPRAAQDVRGVGMTPRRDMYVRPWVNAGMAAPDSPKPGTTTTLDAGVAAGVAAGEGQGGTHSVRGSPCTSIHSDSRGRLRRSGLRRATADEGIGLEGDADMLLPPGGIAAMAGAARSLPAGISQSPFRHLALSDSGAQPLGVPDFCSPSKKQRMASEPGGSTPGQHRRGGSTFSAIPLGLLDNLPSGLRGNCGRDADAVQTALAARLQQLSEQPTAAISHRPMLMAALASSALPPPAPGGVSPHTTLAMQPPAAQLQQQPLAAQLHQLPLPPPHMPFPPALARALMPPPASRARQIGGLPPPPYLQGEHAATLAASAGVNGGPMLAPPPRGPIMLLPPLALPRADAAPQSRMSSLFPVLTLQNFQASDMLNKSGLGGLG